MEGSGTGPRLIIVCGLPGSAKNTHAKLVQGKLGAIRFAPANGRKLSTFTFTTKRGGRKIEALQWKLAQGFSRSVLR